MSVKGCRAIAVASVATALLAVLSSVASARSIVPNDGNKSPDGAQTTSVEPSSATQREVPYLESAAPTGQAVAVDAALVMTFSQPMLRPSVERSFGTQPAVDGAFFWLDELTVRFQPLRLAHGQTYQAVVAGRSIRGVPMPPQAWQFTTVPGPPVVLAPGPTAIRVPILMYHYIRVNPDRRDRMGFRLSVTPTDFVAQMDWLAAHGYHPVTFQDLNGYLASANGLPSRPIILTFDDGYADFFTVALPVLIKHDFKAVAYVVSGFIGRPGYMTAAQIRQADRAGIEIGSHTVSHADLLIQPQNLLRYELVGSRAALEQLLGHPVLSFCYPSGRFNSRVVAEVQAAGYRDATTTQLGSVRTLAGRYVWGRLRIMGGENLGWFAADVVSVS